MHHVHCYKNKLETKWLNEYEAIRNELCLTINYLLLFIYLLGNCELEAINGQVIHTIHRFIVINDDQNWHRINSGRCLFRKHCRITNLCENVMDECYTFGLAFGGQFQIKITNYVQMFHSHLIIIIACILCSISACGAECMSYVSSSTIHGSNNNCQNDRPTLFAYPFQMNKIPFHIVSSQK